MQHLFDFHNEHRIVTVRLFLEAMVALTGKVNFKSCMFWGSAQLLVVLACFAWFHMKHFGGRLGYALLAAASWHLFSMLNFDNAFWALTAIENFGVLMWAFLAIILFHFRRHAFCFVAAVLAAMSLLGGTRSVRATAGLAVFAFVWNIALALPSALSGLADMRSVSGINPIAFWHTLVLPQTVQVSFSRLAEAVAQCHLPSALRERIGNGCVAFIPS